MILVLGFVTVRMAIRGVQDFRAESRAMRAAASASEPESGISALKKQEVDTDGAEESDDGDDSAALDGENVRSAKAEIGMQMQQLHDDADDPARDDNAGETQDDLQGNSRLNPSRDVPGLPPVLVGAKDTDKAGLLAADDQSDNLTVSDTYNPDRTVHPFPVLMLVWAFVVIILSSLIRGGHGSPSIVGAPCGGIVFYAVAAAAFAAILAVLALYAWWVVRRMRTKERLGFAFLPSDIRWTGRRAAACVVLFSVAGVVAGLLGQGGALMFSPILLEMKALPEVVAATVPFMVVRLAVVARAVRMLTCVFVLCLQLFTALSTTTQFLALGGIRWDYALWYAVHAVHLIRPSYVVILCVPIR